MLAELVRPLTAGLLAQGDISRFFFVRYNLGGPHVRLRVLPAPGREEETARRVRSAAEAFFARHPSPEPLSAETIRERNRGIAAGDPSEAEHEDLVLPCDHVEECSAVFETERYGGAALLGHSLALFTLSSVDTLEWLAEGPSTAASRLGEGTRALVRCAWGLAGDGEEMIRLAGQAADSVPGPLERFVREGDAAFERRPGPLVERVRTEIATLSGISGDGGVEQPRWAAGPRRLAWELREAGRDVRWRIATSHVHMTANRLGLLVAEEVYLARMLRRAARELSLADAPFWREAWEARRAAALPEPSLDEQVRFTLERFAAGASAAGAG